ncbi:MAG TPA: hypothetical protein VMR65_03560 [Candidatus Sulfotelmatobacter sp.]|jgi:hypothetical protein|nr:hypothetical protein [Candidatus Sulfotelmatobacter sp.]
MRYHAAVRPDCRFKEERHTAFCPAECPSTSGGVFEHLRVDRPEALPRPSDRTVDVAILDMNHGWPNVGHAGVVAAIQEVACDLAEPLTDADLTVRALSFDVRRGGVVPEGSSSRYGLTIGTGGPGHLDPRLNDGTDDNAQGIKEDPAWEERLFRYFDAIAGDDEHALLGVCHTFGIMCRWLGVARPVARGPEKGGKSEGVMENALTDLGVGHPLFAALSRQLPDGRRLPVLDSRIYDLIPNPDAARRIRIVATETLGVGGPPGEAMTMMEVARARGTAVPRIFGVNHHPEIIDRTRLLTMLRVKLERGEVARDWYEERVAGLESRFSDATRDAALRTTAEFTFLGPVRFHLTRIVRRRAEALGGRFGAHESEIERALTASAALS